MNEWMTRWIDGYTDGYKDDNGWMGFAGIASRATLVGKNVITKEYEKKSRGTYQLQNE